MHITFKLFVSSGRKSEELRASEKRYVCPPESLLGIFLGSNSKYFPGGLFGKCGIAANGWCLYFQSCLSYCAG